MRREIAGLVDYLELKLFDQLLLQQLVALGSLLIVNLNIAVCLDQEFSRRRKNSLLYKEE